MIRSFYSLYRFRRKGSLPLLEKKLHLRSLADSPPDLFGLSPSLAANRPLRSTAIVQSRRPQPPKSIVFAIGFRGQRSGVKSKTKFIIRKPAEGMLFIKNARLHTFFHFWLFAKLEKACLVSCLSRHSTESTLLRFALTPLRRLSRRF